MHSTVNDLVVSGAQPHFLSLNFFIEESLEVAVPQRIMCSIARAFAEAGVRVPSGGKKVARHGQGGGCTWPPPASAGASTVRSWGWTRSGLLTSYSSAEHSATTAQR